MSVTRVLPLSPTQRAMLVHELAFPASTVLRSQLRLRVEGVLDLAAFDRAWQRVIERHGMLRAAIISQQVKQPVQAVAARVAFACHVEDWRALTSAEQAERLTTWLQDDRVAALSLTRPPLMRVSVLRLADDLSELVWTSHHLVLDRACIALVLGEVARLYDETVGGAPARLGAAGDFAAYLTWVQGRDVAALDRFWKQQLEGLRHSFRLARRSVATGGGPDADDGPRTSTEGEVRVTRPTGAPLAVSLRRLARTHRLTLSTLLLGAWASVLARRTRALDGAVGVTFSGRPVDVTAAEQTVGSFSVNLPVRIQFSTSRSLVDWLRELQMRLAACHEHAAVDPARLRALANLPNDVPLFDSLFVFQPAFESPSFSSAVRWSPCGGTFSTAFPTAIMVSDLEADLEVVLVDRATGGPQEAESLMTVLMDQLVAMTADPTQRLAEWLSFETVAPTPEPAGSHPTSSTSHEPSAALSVTPTEARLLRLWCKVLDGRRVDFDIGFFDAGGTSLQAIALIDEIHREFGHGLPLAAFIQAASIRAMAQQLSPSGTSMPWHCLVPIQPKGAARPVFLVHHGGGGVLDYLPLARALGPDQPLYGLQEPGFDEGTEPPVSIEALAEGYVAELRSLQPRGPYVVGGFCFGGVVAFEMAQQLRHLGEQVDAVLVIDGLAPALQIPRSLSERVDSHVNRLRAMSLSRRARYLVQRLWRRVSWEIVRRAYQLRDGWRELAFHGYRRLGLREPALIRQWHLLRINGELSRAYEPRPYAGRVVLIRSDQPDMAVDFGWNLVVTPPIEICQMPTDDHLTMLKEPHVRVLAEHVRRAVGSSGERAPETTTTDLNVDSAPGIRGARPVHERMESG